uniref:Caud_tail_N domain-containing protein n=1 Tax=Globodera pallida TaxID=36090 RepID=A0A183CNR3_GLOPA
MSWVQRAGRNLSEDGMPKIDDLPENVSDAGLDFNYAVWTAGTVLTLANVRWNSDYRDIVRFEDQSALNTYISDNAGPVHVMSGVTYAAADRPIRIDMPFNPAFRYNYIRVTNPAQPIDGSDFGRTFYYFITSIRYIAPNVTELQIQLDVWQTFAYQMTFGNCYIERGHFGIANEFANADRGRGYLTVPEGLDIGSEYQIAKTYVHTIGGTEYFTPSNTFDIIVLTTVTLTMDPGDINDPNLTTAKGSNFQGLPNGG